MKWLKELLELDTVGSCAFSAALAGLCGALWFCSALRSGTPDAYTWIPSVLWLVLAVTWGLRAFRAHRRDREKEEP